MKAAEVINIYKFLEELDIEIWVDGGWGIDALLGKQTREHADLDIAIPHKYVEKLRNLLAEKGYEEVPRKDSKDCNFVLGDYKNNLIDVHTFTFDKKGNNIFGIAYPKDSLTGTGIINGYRVNCISLEWVIKFHEQYAPDENDVKDIKSLVDHFGVKPPKNYFEVL